MEKKSQYTYIAFISYKREDKKWAQWLQEKLESYKIPISIRNEHPELPKQVKPIFRDTTDLSGGTLEKSIKEGLNSSKYLIVICSPRAAQSPWVCKEVQEFIDSGREENIIPFIIEGEPHSDNYEKECFPKALFNLSGSRELLGININENGRDSAAIKVIARMFELRFDVLWDRYKRAEKKRKRIVYCVITLIIMLLLTIAAISTFSYLKLKRLNNENIELNEGLVAANQGLKLENFKTRNAQSRFITKEAEELMLAGKTDVAVALCMHILGCDTISHWPYNAHAETILRKCMAKKTLKGWQRNLSLCREGSVNECLFLCDDSVFASSSTSGTTLYHSYDGTEIFNDCGMWGHEPTISGGFRGDRFLYSERGSYMWMIKTSTIKDIEERNEIICVDLPAPSFSSSQISGLEDKVLIKGLSENCLKIVSPGYIHKSFDYASLPTIECNITKGDIKKAMLSYDNKLIAFDTYSNMTYYHPTNCPTQVDSIKGVLLQVGHRNDWIVINRDDTVEIMDTSNHRVIFKQSIPDFVYASINYNDSHILLIGSEKAELFSIKKSAIIKTFYPDASSFSSGCVSNNGKHVVFGYKDGSIESWYYFNESESAQSSLPVLSFPADSMLAVAHLNFGRRGPRRTGAFGRNASDWSIGLTHSSEVYGLYYSSGFDENCPLSKIYYNGSIRNNEFIQYEQYLHLEPLSLAFDPEEKYVVAVFDDNTIRVFDPVNNIELLKLPVSQLLQFEPASLWDEETNESLVYCTFDKNGQHLLLFYEDKCFQYPFSPLSEILLEAEIKFGKRLLNDAEKQRYFIE